MADTKEVLVRIDDKNRITLPKNIRKALGLKAGNTLFFMYDPQNNRAQIALAASPFDIPAEMPSRSAKKDALRL